MAISDWESLFCEMNNVETLSVETLNEIRFKRMNEPRKMWYFL